MAWLLLFIAGLCEVAWAITLKYSDGFTRLWPTVGVFAGGIVSVYLLGLRRKTNSHRNSICGVDRHWRDWNGAAGHRVV